MERLIQVLYSVYNFIKKNLVFIFWRVFNRKENSILEKNKQYFAKHRGEKCFILGNGPSLCDEDLELLRDEIVFTVNQISRNNQYSKFKTSYYFCIDDNFFNVDISDSGEIELLNAMQKVVNNENAPICFYPLKHKEYVEKHHLVGSQTCYLLPGLYLTEKESSSIDLTKYIPSFGTVVQYAIYVAIYMGFSEIYLLGCDSTGIMSTLNSVLKQKNDTYSYEVTENERKRMENMVEKSQVLDYAYSYYMTLKGFDILKKKCDKMGIRLVNCSSKSVLDMIPKEDLSSVLKKK